MSVTLCRGTVRQAACNRKGFMLVSARYYERCDSFKFAAQIFRRIVCNWESEN